MPFPGLLVVSSNHPHKTIQLTGTKVLHENSCTFDIVVGFGESHASAILQADGSLSDGYKAVLKKYNGVGRAIGWEDYINT